MRAWPPTRKETTIDASALGGAAEVRVAIAEGESGPYIRLELDHDSTRSGHAAIALTAYEACGVTAALVMAMGEFPDREIRAPRPWRFR